MSLQAHSDRLVKLFKLMMSTTSAGEVVVARDMMVKIVTGENKDIHDLADVLVNGLDPKEAVVWEPPSLDKPACDVAAWCLYQLNNGATPQNERELSFLHDMTCMWGTPSEKQAKWLASIHNRLVRRMHPGK